MRVLIVEDEVRLADALAEIMRREKYIVDAVYDGKDGFEYALHGNYDVIVLDVMLPKMDGFFVVSELRKHSVMVPIVMLTAKDSIEDKINGLDRGADDYMTKPFAPEELLARIRALTRRQGEVVWEEIQYEDLKLNVSTYDLCAGAKGIRLSYKEFEIMKILMSNAERIVQKETLILKVWGSDSNAEDNNVEAYISFLRKKLQLIRSRVSISTIRKVGYKLEVCSS